MPPGSPNTESCTCILVIVPPTKCTYCMGEDNTYLFGCIILKMGDIDVLASALHGYCGNWKDTNVTYDSFISPQYALRRYSLSPPRGII